MSFVDGLREFVSRMFDFFDDEEIEIVYPEHSALAGSTAGRLIRQMGDSGPRYRFEAAPEDKPRLALAPLVTDHRFEDLADLANGADADGEAYLSCTMASPAILVVIDPIHPERGRATMAVARHPDFRRWSQAIPMGQVYIDLTHDQLADLVLDGQECLVSRADARQLARFRYVRTVEAAADRATGDESVKVSFRGAGGKPGAEEDFAIPRDVELDLPAYTGAWEPGQEPRHRATIRLRVVPPKGDGAPLFRASWADAPGFELAAATALTTRVREIFGERPVYRGVPSVVRYVIPGAE